MQRQKLLRSFLLGCAKSVPATHCPRNKSCSSSENPILRLLLLLPSSTLPPSSPVTTARRFSWHAVEQFSDDEYECDFENQKASSSVVNIDEWKWKLSLLLRNENDQEIVSRDKRDRRDYEQISNLAKRMGLYSELYGKAVVASKVPLPNYRPDLDDKRPQREVVIPLSLQRRVEGLLQEHVDRIQLSSGKGCDGVDDAKSTIQVEDPSLAEDPDSYLDRSVMEKVLQRRSLRMRNMQRASSCFKPTYFLWIEPFTIICKSL